MIDQRERERVRWEVGASLKRQAGGERAEREVKDEEDRVGEERGRFWGALTQRGLPASVCDHAS